MTESEKNIVEKRVTKTVIRRRAKKAEPAAEEVAEREPAAEASAGEEASPKLAAVPEAVPVGELEVPAVETEEPEAADAAEPEAKEEAPEKKVERARPKKSVKKKTRDDLLMEEYEKAGGLKQAAVMEVAGGEEAEAEPMERVFQPVRQSRRRRIVGKREFKKTQVTTPSARKRKIKINNQISVADLAQNMGIKVNDLIKHLVNMGTMVTANNLLDFDTSVIVAEEFGYEVENVGFSEEQFIPQKKEEEIAENLEPRPPVVTVMGHVDHGKTTLLDYIRKTKVTAGEAGGITQHIGAYQVKTPNGVITFIDTPGHEAFTAMRARGAKVTDLVILTVAADDGVKPQTIEAINHAKAAQVPIVVAINKIDKAEADPERVKRELSEKELLAEDWGGDIVMVPISALNGQGVDHLLEMVLLQAELLELKANPKKPASGHVLEAKLETGRGPVATVIIEEGTLKRGDPIVAGTCGGKARALFDSSGKQVKEVGPSGAVEVLGLTAVPSAGDLLHVLESDADVKKIVGHREGVQREAVVSGQQRATIDDVFARIQEGEKAELKIVIKGDVQGSIEALEGALAQLGTEKVTVKVIHTGVGAISESDVMLAEASQAIVIGFNVRPDSKARQVAENAGVSIKLYRVIYEVVDDVKAAMLGLLEPTQEEEYLGRAEVRDTFNVSNVGTIAGSSVVDGKILRGASARVLRDGTVIYEGKLSSLKRFKDDAKEVAQGYECGIGVENFNDIKIGDVIEAFRTKEVAATL